MRAESGLCVRERSQKTFIAIKTGEYDEDPPVGGDPQCSEVIENVANRDVRIGVFPKRERHICTTPRLVSNMRSHRLHGVGQNHRLMKIELERDATHSFQQRDTAQVRQRLRRICDDQQWREKRFRHATLPVSSSNVNAIIDRHYQCISAASRQLFLNSLKSSVITEKAKKMCRIHDARPTIAKSRNTK